MNAVVSCCSLVCVPGQKFWHTHRCPNCASFWTHIAPTPMTQAKNREIHTCTKCGTLVYTFEQVEQGTGGLGLNGRMVAWAAGGLLLGLVVAAGIDRRR